MYQPELVTFTMPDNDRQLPTLVSKIAIPNASSVDRATETAWVMGVWLADGSSSNPTIFQIGEDIHKGFHHTPIIQDLNGWHLLLTGKQATITSVREATDTANEFFNIRLGIF